MKKIITYCSCTCFGSFCTCCFFAHDHARVEQHHYGFDYIPSSSDKGGYTGDLESGIVTVLEAKKLGNSVYVKLRGKISF